MKPIQYNVFWKIHKSIFIQAAYNPKIQRKSEVTFRIAMIPKYLTPNRTECSPLTTFPSALVTYQGIHAQRSTIEILTLNDVCIQK